MSTSTASSPAITVAIHAWCEEKWNQRKLSYLWQKRDEESLVVLVTALLSQETSNVTGIVDTPRQTI